MLDSQSNKYFALIEEECNKKERIFRESGRQLCCCHIKDRGGIKTNITLIIFKNIHALVNVGILVEGCCNLNND